MSVGNCYFIIVGSHDNPIFEIDFTNNRAESTSKEDHRHLSQFILHAALDIVEETMWTTNSMYLKVVDKFNEWFISSFVTAGHVKFMLLHDVRNEEAIKSFFNEVHELYIKHILNTFYQPGGFIKSTVFTTKVKNLARKYL
eukprot:Sdes_comp20479_c0_seq1m14802